MLVDTMDHAGRVIEPVYLHFLVEMTAGPFDSRNTTNWIEARLLSEDVIPIYDEIGNIVQLKYKTEKHRLLLTIKYGV